MTISGIQASNLQALRAQQAFQKNIKNNQEIQKPSFEEDVKVSISSKAINRLEEPVIQEPVKPVNPYVTEIQNFAAKHNIHDLDEEDIQDAMQFGTSILASYTA